MPPELILEAYVETLRFLILLISDIPKERRAEMWERWFLFWEPVWVAAGLDIKKVPKLLEVPK